MIQSIIFNTEVLSFEKWKFEPDYPFIKSIAYYKQSLYLNYANWNVKGMLKYTENNLSSLLNISKG